MNILTLLPSPIADAFNTLFKWYQSVAAWVTSVMFNTANAASGTTSATLNTSTGVVTYTSAILGNASQIFTLSNSLAVAGTVINFEIKYNTAGTGLPQKCYYFCDSTHIYFVVLNNSATPTDQNIIINYTIIA